jgi:hypothetical protein
MYHKTSALSGVLEIHCNVCSAWHFFPGEFTKDGECVRCKWQNNIVGFKSDFDMDGIGWEWEFLKDRRSVMRKAFALPQWVWIIIWIAIVLIVLVLLKVNLNIGSEGFHVTQGLVH